MRTITKTQLERLLAQKSEAETLGLTKLASNIQHQIDKNVVFRENNDFYSYASDEMQQDVEKLLWDAVIRVADFYGANIDADKAQQSVEKIASDLIDEIRINTGVLDGVGAYEPNVPGENREHVAIELEEQDERE